MVDRERSRCPNEIFEEEKSPIKLKAEEDNIKEESSEKEESSKSPKHQ